MDIEILSEPYDIPAALETVWNPAYHRLLPEYHWLRTMKDRTRNERLFVYANLLSNKFVLAAWVYTPEEAPIGIMTEVENFSCRPDVLWPRDLLPPSVLEARLRPVEELQEERRGRLAERKRRRREAREQDRAEKREAIRTLRRRGMDVEAHLLQTGRTPWVGGGTGGESLESTRADIARIRKRKVTA